MWYYIIKEKEGDFYESENSIKDHFRAAYCSRIDLRELHNNINNINIGLFAYRTKGRFKQLQGVIFNESPERY